METIKKSMFALLIALAIFSCDNSGPEPPPPPPPVQGEPFTGIFALELHEGFKGVNLNNVLIQTRFSGAGDMSLMSAAYLEIDHLKAINTTHGEQDVRDGNFKLWSDSGAEIYGTFQDIIERGDVFEINAEVKGGYGSFNGVYGTMRIQLQRKVDGTFHAYVTGRLFQYEPSKFE